MIENCQNIPLELTYKWLKIHQKYTKMYLKKNKKKYNLPKLPIIDHDWPNLTIIDHNQPKNHNSWQQT